MVCKGFRNFLIIFRVSGETQVPENFLFLEVTLPNIFIRDKVLPRYFTLERKIFVIKYSVLNGLLSYPSFNQ